jgi:replicative DNA helicase
MNETAHKPPQSRGMETWVVGCVLLDPKYLDEIGFLRPDDFFHDDLKQLYATLTAMRQQGEPIDVGLLEERMKPGKWMPLIIEAASSVAVAAHCVRYARKVADLAQLRRLAIAGHHLYEAACEYEASADEVLCQTEAELSSITANRGDHEPVTLAAAALEASAAIDRIQTEGRGAGLMTGLECFDSKMGGLFPGELTILAARPGLGKTSLALQVANYNAGKGRSVYFASLEMSALELSTRLACATSGISNRIVRTGKLDSNETAGLAQAFGEQGGRQFDIHDDSSITVASIRREIRRRKKRGIRLAAVDYLQLITPEDRKAPREQQVAVIVRGLKQTAREFEIPILCLCQLNRQVDDEYSTPKLGNLRESGSIEQDADVVMFLSRHKPTPEEPHNALLTVAKNRNGETGSMRLEWTASRTRFSSYRLEEFAAFS